MNNEPLKQVSIAKNLGMYINENLKWDKHINVMISTVSAKIGNLGELYLLTP